jgi:hypothetical protein
MSIKETLVLLVLGYAIAVFAIVGMGILQYEIYGVNLRNSIHAASPHRTSKHVKLSNEVAIDIVKYGVFGERAATDKFHSLTHFAIKDEVETRKYVSTDALEFEVPWLPSAFHNGWFFLGLLIVASLIIAGLLLGPVQLRRKVTGWKSWFETSDNIRRGIILPNFFIFIADGVFHVVGPLYVLRVLALDVQLLGALVFAENAVQILVNKPNDNRVQEKGNKRAQRTSAHILLGASAMFAALPFLPREWVANHPWWIFAWYLCGRLLTAWGCDAFEASFNSAMNNSNFLPLTEALRTLEVFYGATKAGNLLGALLALIVLLLGLDVEWCFVIPVALFVLMRLAVDAIPENAFPPDPAELIEEQHYQKQHAGAAHGAGHDAGLGASHSHGAEAVGHRGMRDFLENLGGDACGGLTNFSPIWCALTPTLIVHARQCAAGHWGGARARVRVRSQTARWMVCRWL